MVFLLINKGRRCPVFLCRRREDAEQYEKRFCCDSTRHCCRCEHDAYFHRRGSITYVILEIPGEIGLFESGRTVYYYDGDLYDDEKDAREHLREDIIERVVGRNKRWCEEYYREEYTKSRESEDRERLKCMSPEQLDSEDPSWVHHRENVLKMRLFGMTSEDENTSGFEMVCETRNHGFGKRLSHRFHHY